MTLKEKFSEELPMINVDTGLETCGGDEEFYMELMGDFTAMNIKEELVQFYQDNDFKNYSILIHGFKNNAYSLGAKELGDLSYELEKLSKEGFAEDILSKQELLFAQFDVIREGFFGL